MARNLFDRLLKKVSVARQDDSKKGTSAGTISNQMIVNELKEHFKKELERRSFEQQMLYPLSFEVCLAPCDFDAHDDFRFIPKQAVIAFYKVIKSYQDKFPQCLPERKGEQWDFNFLRADMKINGCELQQGNLIITSKLRVELPSADKNAPKEEDVSVCIDRSHIIEEAGFYRGSLDQLEIVSTTHFRIPFNSSLVLDECESDNKEKIYARLQYKKKDGKRKFFNMASKTLILSGKSEERDASNILKVDSEKVRADHAQIKCFDEGDEKKLRIASFASLGETLVNGQPVPPSDYKQPEWVDLPKKSTITLANDIVVDFESLV